MRLFAANVSNQNQEIQYRLPEKNRGFSTPVPMGANVQVSDNNLSERDIEAIYEQCRPYGMVDAGEVSKVADNVIIPIVFSKDRPVPAEFMNEIRDSNRALQTSEGRARRRDLAVVASRLLGDKSEHAQNTLSVSIEEQGGSELGKQDGDKLQEGYAAPESHHVRSGKSPEPPKVQKPSGSKRRDFKP